MRITLVTILVQNQSQALVFYRDTLGFVLKEDAPSGGARWITLASPQDPDGPRISLEPVGLPLVQAYQAGLKEKGIPLTAFEVDDLEAEHRRLLEAGVVFNAPPIVGDTEMPGVVMLDDTCGNWIMLYGKRR